MDIIPIIAVSLVSIILIFIIITIFSMTKGIRKKVEYEKSRVVYYHDKLKKINRTNPSLKDLDNLDKLARDFFNERYKLKYNLTYLELSEKFRKQKDKKKEEFCIIMSEMIFSGKRVKTKEIIEAIKYLSKILEEMKLK
jgi:hypothetical protein